MSEKAYGVPVLEVSGGTSRALRRVSRATGQYDEAWLQRMLYEHPECLPIDEIDSAYSPIAPVCRELATGTAGFIDILYATPEGRLVMVETKLWRNPQARREVIGQILDYAKVISKWSVEELDGHIRAARSRRGGSLYEAVAAGHSDIDIRLFHDDVARNLRLGRFMLLIVGDGIREGIGEIADFLERYATMDFSLGLVEMSVFDDDGGRLIMPRVVSRTETIKRWVLSVSPGAPELREEQPEEAARDEAGTGGGDEFYVQFWKEFVRDLKLDDTTQTPPNPTKIGLVFLPMPPAGGVAWITVFFNRDEGNVGAFLTFRKGAFGDAAYAALLAEKEQIDKECSGLRWKSEDGKHKIVLSKRFGDLREPRNREPIKRYLMESANSLVNAFRSRLKRIADSQA